MADDMLAFPLRVDPDRPGEFLTQARAFAASDHIMEPVPDVDRDQSVRISGIPISAIEPARPASVTELMTAHPRLARYIEALQDERRGCYEETRRLGSEVNRLKIEAETEGRDFDRDPAVLAWARAKVQGEVDRCVDFGRQALERDKPEMADVWRRIANHLRREFIGDGGCVVVAFDERLPQLKADRNREESK